MWLLEGELKDAVSKGDVAFVVLFVEPVWLVQLCKNVLNSLNDLFE